MTSQNLNVDPSSPKVFGFEGYFVRPYDFYQSCIFKKLFLKILKTKVVQLNLVYFYFIYKEVFGRNRSYSWEKLVENILYTP